MNGRIGVVTFLVSFGCNIWALTNDYRNALQLAKENEHHQIADMLDEVYNEQEAKNKSEVMRKRKSALKDVEIRIKKVEKQWKKTLKKEKKENKKMSIANGENSNPSSRKSSATGPPPQIRKNQGYPQLIGTQNKSAQKVRERDANISYGPASALYQDPTQEGPPQIEQQQWTGSLKGNTFKNTALSLMAFSNTSQEGGPRDNENTADELLDAHSTTFGKKLSEGLENGVPKVSTGLGDFIDEVGDEINEPIELFLAVNDLSDYLMVFVEEDIDLKALMMLTEQEISEQLPLGLGPRKKLMAAIRSREQALAGQKEMKDSFV